MRKRWGVMGGAGGKNSQGAQARPGRGRPGLFRPYVWICLGAMLLTQMLVYYATRLLLPGRTLNSLATALDGRIPFVPEWIVVYFLSYVSWLVSALWIISDSRAHGCRFAAAYVLSLLLAGAAFLAYPGTIQRPDPVGAGFFPAWVRLLYRIDPPTNLCPSLHVMLSYFCWRGTMGCRTIPGWYRWFNLLFLILVCLSILFIKQHAVVDIPAAVVVGEFSLQTARLLRPERILAGP